MSAAALDCPRRAEGVELLGRVRDMAYADERWLICSDGARYIQATPILYHVLLHADGTKPVPAIASAVAADVGREVAADDVRTMLAEILAPAGLLMVPGQQSRPAVAQAPVLGVRWRLPLLPYRSTRHAAAVLQHLYSPFLVVPLAAAGLAVNVWVLFLPGLAQSIRMVAFQPELVLVLAGIEIGTRVFHELGHASALRRAGTKHGTIGVAIYLVLPVFYTDVSHAYRLSRWQRVRVDLGGIYFDLITTGVLFAAYLGTGWSPLLLAILLIGLGILEQFTPFMRFDGYYLFADLIGVHEPLSVVGAFFRDLLPWNWKQRRMPRVRRWVAALLTAYAVLVAVFLVRPAIILAVAGRALLEAVPAGGEMLWNRLVVAWGAGDTVMVAASALQLVFWAIIPAGFLFIAWALLRALMRLLAAGGRRLFRRQPATRPLPSA